MDVFDSRAPSSGSLRVIRGGCWNLTALFCRSAYRDRFAPGIRNYDLSFRLALSTVQ